MSANLRQHGEQLAVVAERSVSNAAGRLTQSAVSHALRRFRTTLGRAPHPVA
jgi:DNA-binding transcriptional LysR family regulator